MERITPEWLHLAFDLTPFYSKGAYPDYSGYSELAGFDINTRPIKDAADFYNECVEDLFKNDLLLMPTFYMDAMAGIYPVDTISKEARIVEF